MKKVLSTIITLVMAMTAINMPSLTVSASTEYVYFPDPVVNEYMILNFDTNSDGKISTDEITFPYGVYINLSNTAASNLIGLDQIKCGGGGIDFYLTGSQVMDISPLFLVAKYSGAGSVCINVDGTAVNNFEGIKGIEPNNVPIYLAVGGVYGDLSPLDGWNIIDLQINGGIITTGFSANTVNSLYAPYTSGDGLAQIVGTASNVNQLYINEDYVQYIPNNLNSLYNLSIYGNVWYGDPSYDFLEILESKNLENLNYLYLDSCEIDDLTPLNNMNVTDLSISGSRIDRVGDQTIGDYLLGQAVKIPSLTNIYINWCKVTDLEPLKTFKESHENGNVSFGGNWISLANKNNKEIYDEINQTSGFSISLSSSQFGSVESKHVFSDGTELTSESLYDGLNKQAYIKGEDITYTVSIKNTGTTSADFDLSFYLQDENWDKITVKGGTKNGRNQSVTDLKLGETVNKSITFSANSNFDRQYLRVGVLVTNGSESVGMGYDDVVWKSNLDLSSPEICLWGETLKVTGQCAPGMKSVEIQTSDGEVLAQANYHSTVFSADINLPDKYAPAGSGTENKNTIGLKAVVMDEEGNKFESDVKTVSIIKSDLELANGYYEDCHYMVFGSSHVYDKKEPSIIYYGNRLIIRTKIVGIPPEEIASVAAIVNNRTYDMGKKVDGKYKDYYTTITNGIITGDYLNIVLRVTTTSGETYETLVGYGRVLIDPSGIITDPNEDPITGVKVTLQKLQDDGETWVDWDAENYLQENPVYTNEIGYYGWDVPEGTYRIIAEKEGYVTKIVEEYYSRDQGEVTKITVLPPRLDVDFSMEYADPENPPVEPMADGEAKTAIENALTAMKLSADAVDTDVTDELTPLLTENMYISFKSGTYVKTESTSEKEGSITGTLYLENIWTSEYQEIEVNVPLATETVAETTPEIEIDFENEVLTGFASGNYTINGASVTPEDSKLAIGNYIGQTISIVKKGNGTTTVDSTAQSLEIPSRSAAPTGITATAETELGKNDGKIIGTDATMEYKKSDADEWTDCIGGDIVNLTAGTYKVRVKATSTGFASAEIEVTINAGGTPPVSEWAYTINDIIVGNGTVNVAVTKNTAIDGILIVAAYTDDGRLINVSYKDIPSENFEYVELNMNTDDAAYITAFVWNNMIGMTPIGEKKSKNV